jgi:hypothetical protein
MSKIEIHSKGSFLQETISDFVEQYQAKGKNEVQIIHYTYNNLDFVSSLTITIVGTIVANVITEILKHIARKKIENNKNFTVKIVIKDTGKVYQIENIKESDIDEIVNDI